ncbi:MAG: hypothetical protein JO261_07350 [Alphaproteobacteria bacterium]|nr:hypothetical protein [Alphaproteobacteria bacterium]MBV9693497.1 hypothetical protein [Alphaproteobacteria bacterium]
MPAGSNRHILDPEKIVQTTERLRARVAERFPSSGLAEVAADLTATAQMTSAWVLRLSQPYLGLRLLAALVVAFGLAAQVYVARLIDWRRVIRQADLVALTQGLDSVVNLLLLAFAAIWFVLTLEQRLKRRRVQRRLYELRSFAHVIDMHQLTKDPTVVLSQSEPTQSSPERRMSEFELSRYLDYCAEMLALISKLAALYAEPSRDSEVISAVNEIEELTSNLGRKIWQKIMILSNLDERRAGHRS